MIGDDFCFDPGIGVCGKAGQGVPVGVGQPSPEDHRPDGGRDEPVGAGSSRPVMGRIAALAGACLSARLAFANRPGGNMIKLDTRLRFTAGLAALMTACAVAPGAQAQVMIDVIGNTVGNAVAAQRAYEAEQACLAGKPVEEKLRVKVEAAVEATIADYFRHAAASDQKQMGQLFLVKAKDVRWSTRQGLGEIGALQDPYAALVAPAPPGLRPPARRGWRRWWRAMGRPPAGSGASMRAAAARPPTTGSTSSRRARPG